MVIIKLIGGMGNQMFIYAIGKALAIEKKQQLYVDDSWIRTFELENNSNLSALQYFDEKDVLYRKRDVFRFFDIRTIDKIINKSKKYNLPFFSNIVDEKSFNYDKSIFEIRSSSVYLRSGYWQSFKYFDKYQDSIRKAFSFRKEIYTENKRYADKINSCENSISIHIRRGDYDTNPTLKKLYGGICTLDYYKKSFNYISQNVDNPIFFLFSDDIPWVKRTLGEFDFNIEYIDQNIESTKSEIGHKNNGYVDMYLMTLCKHNIIANSSFSWWGAWLNSNNEKIVIAPKKWFNDSRDTSDLVPAQWIRL